MWKVFVLLLFLECFVDEFNCEAARYDGYKLVKVKARHARDLEAIKRIYDMADDRLDFWREPRSVGHEVDIMVGPQHEQFLNLLLKDGGLASQKVIDDIQAILDEQTAANLKEEKAFFGKYQNLSKIEEWMYTMGTDFPDIVSVLQIATSFEKRPIHLMKVSAIDDRAPEAVKPAVFIMGGIHAREWLSPATVMFIANELVMGYYGDGKIKELLDALDWYILPVANVDGYQYTWESSSSRFWRKTRSYYDFNRCRGADPNRNWGDHWGESGVSVLSCDDTYAGPSAFSETEVRQLADYLTELHQKQPIRAFIDFHAYSQLWMTPYGFDSVLPDNYMDQYYLATNATKALRDINGTEYIVGNIADIIYKASGNSVDWVTSQLGVPYAYAVELPDRGEYGFLMPPRYIIPIGEETMEAVKVMGQGVIEYGEASNMAPSLTTA